MFGRALNLTMSVCRRKLSTLPLGAIWTAPGGFSLTVEPLRASSGSEAVSKASAVFQDASRRADNVGTDELPTSVDQLVALLDKDSTAAFTYTDPASRSTEAVVLVTPCPHARSLHPTLCTVAMAASERLQRRSGTSFWHEFAGSALGLAARQGSGSGLVYSACVTNVFVTCTERVLALRQAGFHITACVPLAGKLCDDRSGSYNTGDVTKYVSNYVMYAELSRVAEPPPVKRLLHHIFSTTFKVSNIGK
jgi:hypothetical protein